LASIFAYHLDAANGLDSEGRLQISASAKLIDGTLQDGSEGFTATARVTPGVTASDIQKALVDALIEQVSQTYSITVAKKDVMLPVLTGSF